MAQPGSVTAWIEDLKTGDSTAASQLLERYYQRLVGLARARLKRIPRRVADEKDVAQVAFASFCRGAQGGQFPQLRDRNNLWPLLALITTREASNLVRHYFSQTAGGGKVGGESALLDFHDPEGSRRGIEQVPSQEPSPETSVIEHEEYERLLQKLGDDKLRQIAVLKTEGYSDKEVAAKLNCGLRTIERKLERIREILKKEIAQ